MAITLLAFSMAYGISLILLEQLQHIEKFQGYLSGEIDRLLFVQLLVGSMTMAVIGALIPALIAARIDPIILINRGQ
jgi:ABC-type antimicrobial peptide transport system permease subunit